MEAIEEKLIQNTKDIADLRLDHKILSDEVSKLAKNVTWMVRTICLFYFVQLLPPEKLNILLDKAPIIIDFFQKLTPIGG